MVFGQNRWRRLNLFFSEKFMRLGGDKPREKISRAGGFSVDGNTDTALKFVEAPLPMLSHSQGGPPGPSCAISIESKGDF